MGKLVGLDFIRKISKGIMETSQLRFTHDLFAHFPAGLYSVWEPKTKGNKQEPVYSYTVITRWANTPLFLSPRLFIYKPITLHDCFQVL